MSTAFGLEGKVALVTGVGSQIGIGRAIVKALASAGAIIAANDVIAEDLATTVAELEGMGAEVSSHLCDVSDRHGVRAMVAATERSHGRIDVLINNAGIAKAAKLVEMTEEQYQRTLNVNLGGCFNASQAVAPLMMKQGHRRSSPPPPRRRR